MKPKDFSKKLKLSKKTIAHLNGSEMKEVIGGDTAPWLNTCNTCLCHVTTIVTTCPTNGSFVEDGCCNGCVE